MDSRIVVLAIAYRAAFLGLAALTYRRHGLPPRYPPAFHDALARLAKRDPRVIWEWCEHDGRAACSHIYFVEDGVLQAWQSYFDKRFSFLKPNAYIRYALALRMAHQGVTRLNLGSTPPRATGLAYYKARWGGREVVFPTHMRVQGAAALLAALRARGRAAILPQPREISVS
jgi:hypothetical protein